jgi:chemotaxis protein MotA
MDIATGIRLLAGAVVLLSLILMGGDLRMFLDSHAFIVIFGGSFAATLIRFPLTSIFSRSAARRQIRLHHAAHDPARPRR